MDMVTSHYIILQAKIAMIQILDFNKNEKKKKIIHTFLINKTVLN